ncbi:helix-turn-helix domain-containing protein [Streptomyces sp. TRM66268-LWL]|uniref:Helix-turn-helix domain-containing protein n=1 Tax=Streptomyces polyasparticus TaxID=2767826 RepID=A0ABR7SXZ8_9ACTN|nr:helix-turn-helix transcriptional regulator [Streptomyces polyasparticus]MBC9719138.1 helix-turn-helix domain-containing protein [Streptomyces polyasparticus]
MRSNPTGRQIRFGAELRRLRERAGLTATDAGQLLGIKQNQVSNMEAGRVGVSAERLRTLARHYVCSDQEFVSALVDMTGERGRGWWEEYRGILSAGLLDLAEVEHHATRLRTAITAHIPGLLQTVEHAREVFRQVVPVLSPPEIEHRVSFRIKRQATLYGDTPTPYQAIIHEAALRMQFGGPKVARAQLDHVLSAGERDNITIQVIPFSAGAFPGSGQSIYYSHGPVPQLDTVHLDQVHGPIFLSDGTQLAEYQALFGRLEEMALNPAESQDFIHSIIREL